MTTRVSIEKRLENSESKISNRIVLMPYDLKLFFIAGLSVVGFVCAIASHRGTFISETKYIFCGRPIQDKEVFKNRQFCDKWKEPYTYNKELADFTLPQDAKIISTLPATAPLQGWLALGSGVLLGFGAILANSIAEDRRVTDPHRKIGEMLDFELSRIAAAIQVAEKNKLLNSDNQNYISAYSGDEMPPVVEIKIDRDQIIKNLFGLFSSRKINAEYYGTVDAPSFLRIKVGIDNGTRYGVVEKMVDDIKIQCALQTEPLISAQAGYISIDVAKPTKDRRIVYYKDYALKLNREKLTFPIGVNIDGEIIEADMSSADSTSPHFLIGGTTRCGKSQLVTVFIISLMMRFAPDQLQFIIIDPKQVDFRIFENMAWVKDYKCFVEDATQILEDLLTESQDRYTKFAKVGARNLDEYNAMGNKMPRIVLIYDEYGDHVVSSKENKEKLEQSLPRIAAIAAAAGIHLIFSTQRPDKDVVTPLIRSNLPGRIALRTKTNADGTIIMGRECPANYLLGRGDLIYDSAEEGFVRLQSMYIGDNKEIQAAIAELSAKYPSQKIKKSSSIVLEKKSDFIPRLKNAMADKSRVGEGLLNIVEAKTTEEMLTVLRFALSVESNPVLLIIKMWGNLSDDPPGNADILMKNYANLINEWIAELDKQGYTKENNWGVSLESI